MVEGRPTREGGRPRRAWSDDIKEWSHLSTNEAPQLTKDRAVWFIMPPMFAPANMDLTTNNLSVYRLHALFGDVDT